MDDVIIDNKTKTGNKRLKKIVILSILILIIVISFFTALIFINKNNDNITDKPSVFNYDLSKDHKKNLVYKSSLDDYSYGNLKIPGNFLSSVYYEITGDAEGQMWFMHDWTYYSSFVIGAGVKFTLTDKNTIYDLIKNDQIDSKNLGDTFTVKLSFAKDYQYKDSNIDVINYKASSFTSNNFKINLDNSQKFKITDINDSLDNDFKNIDNLNINTTADDLYNIVYKNILKDYELSLLGITYEKLKADNSFIVSIKTRTFNPLKWVSLEDNSNHLIMPNLYWITLTTKNNNYFTDGSNDYYDITANPNNTAKDLGYFEFKNNTINLNKKDAKGIDLQNYIRNQIFNWTNLPFINMDILNYYLKIEIIDLNNKDVTETTSLKDNTIYTINMRIEEEIGETFNYFVLDGSNVQNINIVL